MKVVSRMTADVVSVTVDEDITAAFELMSEGQFRHLPVTDRGLLVGIISDRDILLQAQGTKSNLTIPPVAVADVMTKAPVTISSGATLAEAANLMLAHHIDCLPVLGRDGDLVGIITSTDIMDVVTCTEETETLLDSRPEERRVEVLYYAPYVETGGASD